MGDAAREIVGMMAMFKVKVAELALRGEAEKATHLRDELSEVNARFVDTTRKFMRRFKLLLCFDVFAFAFICFSIGINVSTGMSGVALIQFAMASVLMLVCSGLKRRIVEMAESIVMVEGSMTEINDVIEKYCKTTEVHIENIQDEVSDSGGNAGEGRGAERAE